MKRSTTRWVLAGGMALAALGAVAVLDAGSATAEAAPSVSPFAGSYVGDDPRGSHLSWVIEISDGGRITSSYSFKVSGKPNWGEQGSITGRVDADGSYSLTVSRSGWYYDRREGPRESWKSSYQSAGTMVSDAAGIVGTEDSGGTFTWLRQ